MTAGARSYHTYSRGSLTKLRVTSDPLRILMLSVCLFAHSSIWLSWCGVSRSLGLSTTSLPLVLICFSSRRQLHLKTGIIDHCPTAPRSNRIIMHICLLHSTAHAHPPRHTTALPAGPARLQGLCTYYHNSISTGAPGEQQPSVQAPMELLYYACESVVGRMPLMYHAALHTRGVRSIS